MKAIATLRLKMAPKDPSTWTGKMGGVCPLTGKHCTDIAGAHHSKLVEGESLKRIHDDLSKIWYVTRLEVIEE